MGTASVADAQLPRAGTPTAGASVIEDRYIVVYGDTDERTRIETAERESDLGFATARRYTSAIDGFAARLTPSQLDELKRDPEVGLVTEDRRVEAAGYVPRALDEPTPPTGVRRILGATDATVREASGISVAVIDTGIQLDHPDLNAVDGYDCVDPGTAASDENGHGTHVAGTIAAENDGAGVVGVAPGTKVYAVRVLDSSGGGTTSQVLCGIDWVTANASDLEIEVVNMSLGGIGPPLEPCESTTDAMHEAICNSAAAGVNYVVAAGNDGWDFDLADYPTVPAAYPEVLTVTALTDWDGTPGGASAPPSLARDDSPAPFSNYAGTAGGRAHTIAAPGVAITSTWIGSGYQTLGGTSMATPHAAGAMGLCINEAGVDGACANRVPAEVIAELRGQAEGYSAAYPSYGFLHDPQYSPFPWAYFGYLTVAPGAGAPPTSPAPPTPPANDDFEDALNLGDAQQASADGTNVAATKEPGEPDHAPAWNPNRKGGASVWYRWTAPVPGRVSIDPCVHGETDLRWALVGVYTGGSVSSLDTVVSDQAPCWPAEVSFYAKAGVTYHIAVDGQRCATCYAFPEGSGLPDEGAIELRLSAGGPRPPSDIHFTVRPSTRTVKQGEGFTFTAVVTNASTDVLTGVAPGVCMFGSPRAVRIADPCKRLGTLEAGESEAIRFHARVLMRAKPKAHRLHRLYFQATAHGVAPANAEATLKVRSR